jgi:heptaprenylglyceryl phosphate synthase
MTLNQIVQRIKAICEAHEQINTFVFGDIDDKLRQDIVYPAAFLPYPTTQYQGVDTLDAFSLFIMDRVIIGGATTDNTLNELEVTSDCRLIAEDLQAQFLYQKFNPSWNVQKNFSITALNETDPDYLAGVQLQFTIKSPYTANRCQVPTTYTYV